MAAISAPHAPSFRREMDALRKSEYKAETANRWQFPDQAEPAQAGLAGP